MPDLRQYRSKRDPGATPEPFGADAAPRALAPGARRAFVVQQHAARAMHWDLRLEIDGALVSWAIPKGPSLDPKQKRFAARTEDHPLEYADFEGIIPRGNYGAGAMIVWDRGVWRPWDGESPARGLEAGKLDVLFEGHKLSGRFALVRMKGEGGKSWLVLSHRPAAEAGEGEIVEREPASVMSGLTIEELYLGVTRAAEVEELARAAGAPRRELGKEAFAPMLCDSGERAFTREGWLFELKYDGARVVACKRADGTPWLVARSGRDVTEVYPEVARAVRHLPVAACAIDGEVVALDERGRASFERLQHRFRGEPAPRAEIEYPVVFYSFDALAAQGYDLRGLPLRARKQLLSLFAPRQGFVRFADHVEGEGEALFEAARAHALEGIVAKRANSRYESGKRSPAWQKIKVPRTACLAIVGYARGRGSRAALGSLQLAWRREGKLSYAGAAGSGLDLATIDALRSALDPSKRETPACESVPTLPNVVWVEPQLVCEVRYTEVTSQGLLRHPVFERLRPELALADCVAPEAHEAHEAPALAADPPARGAPAPMRAEPKLALTRLDKVFWPVEGFTKGDLLRYYEEAWPWLEPYLRDRPLVLTRYPDGIEGKSFYQKNAPEFTPAWVTRENVDGTDYFICNSVRELLYVINSGAIPLHVWGSRRDALDRPDWLILDLDPKQAPFAHVIEIARAIHALLLGLGAAHFVKTSGQDGLHIMLPLGRALDHEDCRRMAEVLARVVCAELPEIATITRPVAARGRKVYVDFLQNGRERLIAGPFSVRPRAGAPVSMPLEWKQVNARLSPARFTIETALPRIKKLGDPFVGALGPGVDAVGLLSELAERLRRSGS